MAGGDVFDRILDMKHYTEKDARDLCNFLLEAVNYMHENNIAHCDLKPQNLVLQVSQSMYGCFEMLRELALD
jgi:serine/threonine protein kinase